MVRLRKKQRPDSVVAYFCACPTECVANCICVCGCYNGNPYDTDRIDDRESTYQRFYDTDWQKVREMRDNEYLIQA